MYSYCFGCKQESTGYKWCQNCNSKRFQRDFDKWTSGNDRIDKLIQETQLKAKSFKEAIEWIPHNRLRNIEYLDKGGFSTIYKAIWLDGYIERWNYNKQKWKRYRYLPNIASDYDTEKKGYHVALKSLNNSSKLILMMTS